jgi:7-keto-8-aminopelargonate synthetase-like enzyme
VLKFKEEPERLNGLWENSRYMWEGLKDLDLGVGKFNTPIIPLHFESEEKCGNATKILFDKNIMVFSIGFPAVPPGKSIIRLCVTSQHTKSRLIIL